MLKMISSVIENKNVYVFLVILCCLNSTVAQNINWSIIDTTGSAEVEGKINGLNMGGYTYGKINMQNPNYTVLDECVDCIDFSCSPVINQETLVGSEFVSMQTKPNFAAASALLKPSVLRFPGGTHSGWYHYYKYDTDYFYDASNPVVAKGYGMSLGETAYLANPQSYCKNDSRLTVNQNYIDGFINYVNGVNAANPNGKKTEVTYVANLLTHFNFDPITFLCVQTCGKNQALTPMDNYDCTSSLNIPYAGNESLFNNDSSIYRFELYYKETQDAILKIIQELQLTASDNFYVELGNEYYGNIGLNSGYPTTTYGMTVNEYVALAEIYAERLKCFFSGLVNIKVGMVTKPGVSWQLSNNTSNPNYPGLLNLMNQDLTGNGETLNDLIDGIILHDYYNGNNCLGENDIAQRFECAKTAFQEHVESPTGTLWTDLDNLFLNFPNQKIWLTEWNMVAGIDGKNINYINTILHASFVQEYALELLRFNNENNNKVEFAMHHRIGGDLPWSVVQTVDGDNQIATMRASGYVMQFLSKIETYDNKTFAGNVLFENGNVFATENAKVIAIYQKSDATNSNDRVLLYFSNKTAQSIACELPNYINGIAVDNANWSYINGDHLFSYGESNNTNGRNQFKGSGSAVFNAQLDSIGYGILHNSLTNAFNIIYSAGDSIPKHSVGVLEINLVESLSLEPTTIESTHLKVFPNPISNETIIQFQSQQTTTSELRIINTNGQVVKVLPIQISQGFNSFKIELSNLNSGLFILQLEVNGAPIYKKISKL